MRILRVPRPLAEFEALAIHSLTDGGMVFTDVAGVVAGFSEQHGIGSGEGLLIEGAGGAEGDPVLTLILAGEQAGAVGRAGGGGDKGVVEVSAISGELVNVGRFENGVAGAAEVVRTVVIGEDDHNIRRLCRRILNGE